MLQVFDVVMRHYNKSEFDVNCVECDGKFKSDIDEVSNEMRIEISYANPYNHVPWAESNNRVIKIEVLNCILSISL